MKHKRDVEYPEAPTIIPADDTGDMVYLAYGGRLLGKPEPIVMTRQDAHNRIARGDYTEV